jgi:NADP-dependent 3-hydroxy acid dehydrogenase YdfG
VTVLAGRVGVVTGASSGIGAATARELAAAGMRVVLGARRAERLERVAAEIRAAGGGAETIVTDMRNEAEVERLIAIAIERFGQIDALVNNAAIGHVRTVAEGRTEEWHDVLATNVLGTLIACRAALRHMLPQKRGDILNVSSASAHEAWPYLVPYAASKAAIYTLSRALRAEVAPLGIRVMTIEIHNAATEFGLGFDSEVLPTATRRWVELGLLNPAAPLIRAEDVARAIVFQLSQPEAASVHDLEIRSRSN